MPKLTIDRRQVEVPPGATILDAARKLGVDIPTLCFLEGYEPSTSCLVCMVKITGQNRLVPACGTAAVEGMEIESETEEVHQVRRTALELLLSDHLGDCLAPCQFSCPAQMDVPLMLRQIAAGDLHEAIVTVKRDIALPAVLGRICPAPCEKVCRRKDADDAVAICLLKRYVADVDLATGKPYSPQCPPPTAKRVAIVGAGPTGLAAAYYLARQGHASMIFDENPQPGGRLRSETTPAELPRDVLDAEIRTITRLAVELHADTRVGEQPSLGDLGDRFDAVLVAGGASAAGQAEAWGLPVAKRGIQVESETFRTGVQGVFAAGNAIRGKGLVIRSAADGKQAAVAIDQFLRGLEVTGPQKPFSTKIGRMEKEEVALMSAGAADAPRREPAGGLKTGFSPQEAAEQAARCMHCDCRALHSCKLREYAARYHADPRRYRAARRTFQQDTRHPQVIYESGKCIDCGLCIRIASAAGEALGLTFVGRGFDVRLGVPLDGSLADALQKVAAECVAACPTAALAWKDK